MRPGGEYLRVDVPRREVEVYLLVYEHGHAVRWVARHLELSRSTVKIYLQRLKERTK
jgi:DNA-binding CsgD family transcriptional regulator